MNLETEILRQHSKNQTNRIVAYVGNNPHRFKILIDLLIRGPYRVSQRASWPLSICVEQHPELVMPHLNRIVKNLKQPGLHNAVKRNTIRLLQFIQVPERLHEEVVNICFEYLQDNKEAIAVRVFSMTVLANIAESTPDLKRELLLILEDILPYGSAGLRSRARKTIRQLTRKHRE